MQAGRVTLLIGVVVLSIGGGLRCSEPATKPSNSDANLLTNSSFEKNGEATLEGWKDVNFIGAEVVASPAPGGGEFSLELSGQGEAPEGRVMAVADEAHDGGVYRLSAYVRGAGGINPGGWIRLTVGDQSPHREGAALFFDSSWTLLSVTDTVVAGAHDSLKVWLSAFHSPGPTWGAGQFDLVTLERLDD